MGGKEANQTKIDQRHCVLSLDQRHYVVSLDQRHCVVSLRKTFYPHCSFLYSPRLKPGKHPDVTKKNVDWDPSKKVMLFICLYKG